MAMIAEEETNEQYISELLKQVNSLLEIKRKISPVPGEKFNVFSVLNMESDEENTHNRLIYEFLSKDGSHGMGDVFLREFFAKVLEKPYPDSEVHVERESKIKDPDNYGRIDIIIYGKGFCYPIEMKIYAGDQDKQIERYDKHAKDKCRDGDNKVYYLTLDGHEPSEKSLGEGLNTEMEASKDENIDDIKETHVECISFDFHIRNWLERCSEIAWKEPSITGIIQQYIKLLDKLTGHFEEDIFMGEIKNIVGHSRENYESALAIEQSLPKIRTEKMIEFFDNIKKHMDSKCKDRKLEYLCSDYREKAEEYYDKSKKRVYPHLSYLVWEGDKIKIVLRFEVNERFFFGINFYGKDDNQLKCCDVNLSDAKDAKWKAILEKKKVKSSYWLWWMYLPCEPQRENKASDEENVNFMTCDGLYKNLFDPKEFDPKEQESLMKRITDMIDNHLESILKTGLPKDWK